MAFELSENVGVMVLTRDTVTRKEVVFLILPMRAGLIVSCPGHRQEVIFEIEPGGVTTFGKGPPVEAEAHPVNDYSEGFPSHWEYEVRELITGQEYRFVLRHNEEGGLEFGWSTNPETISVCITNGQYRLLYHGDLVAALQVERPNFEANN